MEIWRLEHSKTGHGPYAMGKLTVHDSLLPDVDCAKEDCPGFQIGWVCGCPSKEILEWMFGPILCGLLANSFEIRKYEVPDGDFIMGKSGKQVVFKKPGKKFPFTGLFDW